MIKLFLQGEDQIFFLLIEGRPLEAREPRVLQMPPPTTGTSITREAGDAMKTGTNGATWQYS